MRKLLDIKADEKKKVIYLFFQNFFDGLGTSFFYAMGIFIFLGNSSHHDALHYYPLVFVIGGLLILLISPIYSKIETRARTDYLLYGIGIFVILLVIFSYFLLSQKVSVYTGITLLILYQLIYYLRQTQFWGLSSLSFNVLQSRRLFSIVSAGDLPAKFLGYSLVFKLLQSGTIQPESLIYFAVIAYLISFYFLVQVFKSDHHLKHSSHEHFRSGVKKIKFFGNHLVKAMAIMAFFIMFVVFIVDYSFTKVVMHKINDEDADMYFLVSTILYASYGFASILKLFLTGKVFQKLGLKWTMVITPVLMLLLIFSALLFTIGVDDPNWYFVRLFIFLYIGFIVFRDVIGKPVFLTLFQPLSKKMRLHGHNIVKGIAEPLGMVISGGLLLIYYGYFEEYRLDIFAIALVIPILFWMYSAVNVRKTYNSMLERIINLRLLSGNQFLMIDSKAKEGLLEKLHSDDEIEVLFALDHVKNDKTSVEKIIPLVTHNSELIQKAAWGALAEASTDEQLEGLINNHFNIDSTAELRKHIYSLLGLSAESHDIISKHISEAYPDVTEHILLGWAKSKKFILPEKTEGIIASFLESSLADKYYTGLRLQKIIPSDKGKAYITKSLESNNEKQRKSAIIGSFGFLEPQFFKRTISLMNEALMSRTIRSELVLLGDGGIKHYLPFLKDGDDITTHRLVQVMGQVGSKQAISELVKLMQFRNPDLRKLIIDTLTNTDSSNLDKFKNKLLEEYNKEIVLGLKILAVYNDNVDENHYLYDELKNLIKRIFRLLSLFHDSKIIQRVEEGYFSDNSDHTANSIETLNQMVNSEIRKPLTPLIEGWIDASKSQNGIKSLRVLIDHQASLNKWTVACLLSEFGCDDDQLIKELKQRNSAIINEQLKHNKMDTTSTLRLMEKVIMLKKTNLFGATPENVLVELAGLLKEESYPPESSIFNKDDKGDCMYIIYSGQVKIHDGNSLLATFDQNNFFGDLAMLDTEPRSASATAVSETILLRLDQEAIYELMDDRIEVAQGVIKTLCTRIRDLNNKYVEIENR